MRNNNQAMTLHPDLSPSQPANLGQWSCPQFSFYPQAHIANCFSPIYHSDALQTFPFQYGLCAKSDKFVCLLGNNNEAQAFLSRGGQVIVRMRGLPYDCTAQQVVSHLSPS